jgi:hypothetical protein
MSVRTDIPELLRIQFFNGQRLTAADLTELQRANRELRWLHNRSLHGWGIGIGYGVAGERGDSAVTVAPGYAVDCMGRELILTGTVVMTVPAVAAASDGSPAVFYLTATYKEDPAQGVAEERPGVCLPGGTVRLTEGPLIAWREQKDITDGIDIILAQATVANCQLDSPLNLAVRRAARPSQQPYIAAGQTLPSATVWSMKFEAGIAVGITTRVDTTQARFQATPVYFAHVMGARTLNTAQGPQFAATLVAISQPSPGGFSCDVYLPAGASATGSVYLDANEIQPLLNTLPWSVVWVGIEG